MLAGLFTRPIVPPGMPLGKTVPTLAQLEAPDPTLSQIVSEFRSKTYPETRNKIARAVGIAQDATAQVGGKGTHVSAKDVFHRRGSKNLTKMLANAMPDQAAAHTADALYDANEYMTGILSLLSGRPFFSPYGFNVSDTIINKQGQEEALRELQREREAEIARSFEELGIVPNPYPIPPGRFMAQ